jgi:hypothetical protein
MRLSGQKHIRPHKFNMADGGWRVTFASGAPRSASVEFKR